MKLGPKISSFYYFFFLFKDVISCGKHEFGTQVEQDLCVVYQKCTSPKYSLKEELFVCGTLLGHLFTGIIIILYDIYVRVGLLNGHV